MHRKSSLPVTKMAELSAKKLPRDRKANFTSIEANLISSRVTHELELLKGGFSTEWTNQKKNELWKVITEEVNALGVCMRKENPATNGSQSPCTATPRPTALDRHHSNLQNNEQTCPVADDAEGTDRNATCPGPSSSASSQSKRSSSSCSIQPTPSKKKKTAEDVYALQ
ncbi:unnamed protein product [Mytilus coruscus]|uniref:Myb/SANT-like DNA-binding domain-containing protein n=1 Tax=Mytilus coruscus TaxID=42192 RepID=A0A6J8DE15_MYTCO|nr:unnamed protein product [Mytilus coruscus]